MFPFAVAGPAQKLAPDVAAKVRLGHRESIARRIQQAAPLAAIAFLVIGGLDALAGRDSSPSVSLGIMLALAGLLLAEAELLRHQFARTKAVAVGLFVALCVVAGVGLGAWMENDISLAVLVFATFPLVLPAVVPWGLKPQGTLVIATFLIFAALLHSTGSSLSELASPWGVAVVVALGVSLRVARDVEQVHWEAIQRAEQAEEVSASYRELVENAAEGILRTDINGRILFANAAAADLLGTTRELLLQRSFLDLVAPAAREDVKSYYAQQYRDRIPQTFREVPLVTARGERKWFSQTAQLQKRGNLVEGFHFVFRDITDRVKIVEELRQSEARFRSTFERAPIGIALVAPDGRFLRVNSALCQMLAYSEEELLQRDFQSLTYPDDLGPDLALVAECLEGKRDTYVMEKRYVRRDGQLVFARLHVGLVRDSFGLPVHFVSLIDDVTERKRLESDLLRAKEVAEAATRAKTVFLASMSHEIRTPLTGVLGMLSLLQKTELTAEQKEYVDTAMASGEALLVLLTDLLELSRIESGRLELRPSTVRCRDTFEDVCRMFRARASQKGVALVLDIDASVPAMIHIDAKALRQVLVNLVGNAVKFTSRGSVRLEARWGSEAEGSTHLHIVVRDTGPGIAPEDLQRIFEPFCQTETGRRGGGTGLGLAIVRRFAEAMGGRVWAESTVGQGSAFHVALPALPADAESPRTGESAPATSTLERGGDKSSTWRVLVVEDHPVNQLVLRRLLEKEGHEVVVAGDGEAALTVLETDRFDVLLVDLQMPKLGGIELTRIVRHREANGSAYARRAERVPIVVLTADAWAEDRDRCLAAGADAYLAKPVRAEALFAALQEVIKREKETTAPNPYAYGVVCGE
ncbi:MAG: hypothetical protein KatS3mg077_1764 [Candidatus Binatia bacterium]|nr:MAG: hypothetical protein KatS3mg077_1764 [Candidatus Binatia bacterium]